MRLPGLTLKYHSRLQTGGMPTHRHGTSPTMRDPLPWTWFFARSIILIRTTCTNYQVKVESDGKPIGKQKEYNALCKRTNGSGIRHAEAWGIDYVMARCLIRFQNSASGSSSTSKRDTQEWDEWKVESMWTSKEFISSTY